MADIIINRNPGFNKIIAFNGQADFDFTFPIFGKEHLVVIKNTYTALTLDTDYTIITPIQQQNGGTIRLVNPATAGDIITLILSPPVERTTDFQPGGDFIADVLNTQLDLLTQMVQANKRDIERSVRADFGENPDLIIEQLLEAAGDAAQSAESATTSASDAANSATEAARYAWPRPVEIDNAAGVSTDAVLYAKVKAARLVVDNNEIVPNREFGTDASGKVAMGDGVGAWADLADLRESVRIATDTEASAGVLETVAVNPKQLAVAGGEYAKADFSNVNVPHIVEAWRSSDGFSWYRKYSDGWVEQGGITPLINSTYDFSVNLLVAMADTNYFATWMYRDRGGIGQVEGIGARTTTNFNMIQTYWTTSSANLHRDWFVCGKAA